MLRAVRNRATLKGCRKRRATSLFAKRIANGKTTEIIKVEILLKCYYYCGLGVIAVLHWMRIDDFSRNNRSFRFISDSTADSVFSIFIYAHFQTALSHPLQCLTAFSLK